MFSVDTVIVGTLAEFKALKVRPNVVTAKGKNSIADGWGGDFVWAPGDTTTADDDQVVQCSDGEAGRYRRAGVRPDTIGATVADLATLKALTTRPASVITQYRSTAGDGGGGTWVFRSGDQSANVSADTQSGIWAAPATAPTGASGAWQRQFDGVVHSKWFGAVGDGSTDDTTALNAFFAFASAGYPVHIDKPSSYYKITAGLTAITGNKIQIDGDGRGTVIKYVNAGATTPTIMAIGDGTNYSRAIIRGFTIESGTTLTGGYGLRLRSYQHVDLDIWCGDEFSEGWKLYNAAWLDTVTVCNTHSSHFYGSAKCLIWSAGVELHMMQAFVKGYASGGTSATATGTGVHIGGGCGGFYAESMTQLFNDIGILVDTSITGTANNQIFMGGATVDSNKTVGVRINDALAGSKAYSHDHGWIASTQNGNGLEILAWASGIVDIQSGYVINSSGNQLHVADNTATYTVGDTARIQGTGYGIYGTVAITVYCNARLANNTAGNTNGNITLKTSFDSSILTGTALPSAIVSSSLTSVGTLSSLTVSGAIQGNSLFYFGGTTSSHVALRRSSTTLDVVLGDQSALAALNVAGLKINGLFQFYGTTSSFPAFRRSSAAIDVVLADQSAFATLNVGALLSYGTITLNSGAALKLGNAYVAGAPAATGYVTLQDSAGTTYKVLVST